MSEETRNEQQQAEDATNNPSDETLKTEAEAGEATEANEEQPNRIPYDRFKAKVDEANALKEKLATIEKTQEEAERQKLEEQNEYKQLYEQAQQEAEKAKETALNMKKSALLTQAGYGPDQAELLVKLVDGETDEDIAEAIKQVQATIPAQDNYADPSLLNGHKDKPEPKGADEIGVSAFERIKDKIF